MRKKRTPYPVHASGKRVDNEGRNLIHEGVTLARVKNACKAAHFGAREAFEVLIPIIHDTALPAIVGSIGGSERCVKKTLLALPLHTQLRGH